MFIILLIAILISVFIKTKSALLKRFLSLFIIDMVILFHMVRHLLLARVLFQ